MKVLLVEDNELSRDMLSRRLARKGFEVLLACDGREALHQASVGRPDIVLMDLSLPDMDGWEVTRLLRRDSATASVPIIALTAHAGSDHRETALEAGCNDYDTKPIELQRLLGKIERL